MTVPHPLQLFSPVWFEPVDTRTQVDRMPGTPDAACLCDKDIWPNCWWPFCTPPKEDDETRAN